MLVLSQRIEETIRIGDDIAITVVRIGNDYVLLGITAPSDVPVHRAEVYRSMKADGLRTFAPDCATDRPASPSEKAAHFCETALKLLDEVIGAEEFVGPLCRDRLRMARDKVAAAAAVLNQADTVEIPLTM
uniref:Putative carbon storage regulator n=1 Tax=viral metagenome TaxID=1070528 RepID=A0A6M3KXY3_9ZZZZ